RNSEPCREFAANPHSFFTILHRTAQFSSLRSLLISRHLFAGVLLARKGRNDALASPSDSQAAPRRCGRTGLTRRGDTVDRGTAGLPPGAGGAVARSPRPQALRPRTNLLL